MERYLSVAIGTDLKRKMVFLTGPRQCGKTTLAQKLLGKRKAYYNWDDDADRERILKGEFPSTPGILVLDEIHKYSRWRNLVKGLYDKRKSDYQILVTGSAKLDYYRRGGDSLQGRYHLLRLHPLSVAELKIKTLAEFDKLLRNGGFPEPYFADSEDFSRRWSREYRTRLVREDLLSLERVSDVALVERLMMRLPELVGSPLSINALREDLSVSHSTAERWVTILERLYSVFRIYPFGAPSIRAVKKEAKHYHYDWNLVADPGARFENLVACHLLKYCHWIEDTQGFDMELRYFRDNEKREVDFVVLKNKKPIYFIECKLGQKDIEGSLKYLKRKFPSVEALQLLGQKDLDFTNTDGIRVCHAIEFLKNLV